MRLSLDIHLLLLQWKITGLYTTGSGWYFQKWEPKLGVYQVGFCAVNVRESSLKYMKALCGWEGHEGPPFLCGHAEPSSLRRHPSEYSWEFPEVASFQGLLRLQFLIACSMQKRREKAWGIFVTCSAEQLSNIIIPPLNSQVVYETDLAFCASYEDGTNTSRELHQAYETYPG